MFQIFCLNAHFSRQVPSQSTCAALEIMGFFVLKNMGVPAQARRRLHGQLNSLNHISSVVYARIESGTLIGAPRDGPPSVL